MPFLFLALHRGHYSKQCLHVMIEVVRRKESEESSIEKLSFTSISCLHISGSFSSLDLENAKAAPFHPRQDQRTAMSAFLKKYFMQGVSFSSYNHLPRSLM